MNNPLDLFAWKVRSERKRQHLTQKQLAERLGMNPRTIIDLETCQSNPKFETVVLVAKELNISVDAAIFPEMINQTVSKTVVDFFAGNKILLSPSRPMPLRSAQNPHNCWVFETIYHSSCVLFDRPLHSKSCIKIVVVCRHIFL